MNNNEKSKFEQLKGQLGPRQWQKIITFSRRSVGAPISDEKWSLFQEGQLAPPGVSKNDHYLKKVSRIPVWVTKNEHFHNLDILDSCICVF